MVAGALGALACEASSLSPHAAMVVPISSMAAAASCIFRVDRPVRR
jgi:hypothetical protein